MDIVKFLASAIAFGTPILFGTLGEIVNEKTGHLNLGVEGMMAIGSCFGFLAGYFSGNLLVALLAAFGAGVLSALIYALLTVTFMANQNVTGLTMTIFGVGLANFVGLYAQKQLGSNLRFSEGMLSQISEIHIPVLSDLPVVGPLLFSHRPFVYLGVAAAILLTIYFNHTKTGLNLRTIGENPAAADAAGIRVTRMKYLHLMLGGGLCGVGGLCVIGIIHQGKWMVNSIGGLGWIAVALVIFASWHPAKAILGSFLFGALQVIRYYMPVSVPIPTAVYDMLPFVMTALVLVISSMRRSKKNAQPASCGVNYFREER